MSKEQAVKKKITPTQASKLVPILEEPMDNFNIQKYLPNVPIITYNELPKYGTIDKILPHSGSYAIILYQNSPNSGHWVALYRRGDSILYFCSYGSKIDSQLKWVSADENKKMGINAPYLSQMLEASPYKVYFNTIKHQDEDRRISTCGRFCIAFIKAMKRGMDMAEFNKRLSASGLPADIVVSKEIPTLNQ